MEDRFKQLIKKHRELRKEFKQNENKIDLEKVEALLSEIRGSGKFITDLEQRNILTDLCRDLGEIIFENSDRYPSIRLDPPQNIDEPAKKSIFHVLLPSPLLRLIFSLMIIMAVFFAIFSMWPKLSSPKITIISPATSPHKIFSVPQIACPLTVKSHLRKGLLSKNPDNLLCVLTFVRPPKSPQQPTGTRKWYPWKSFLNSDGDREVRLKLGIAASPPKSDQEFEIVAAVVNCAWFVGELKPVDDFNDYTPLANSDVITVNTVVISPVKLVPKLTQLNAKFFPFADNDEIDKALDIFWEPNTKPDEHYLHTKFEAFSDISYGGWSIQLLFHLPAKSLEDLREGGISDNVLEDLAPLKNRGFINQKDFLAAVKQQIGQEQTDRYKDLILNYAQKESVFDASKFTNIILVVRGENGGEQFEVKLKDAKPENPVENAVKIEVTDQRQEKKIPLINFKMHFRLTGKSFEDLENENIPYELLEDLKALEGEEFPNKEEFLTAIKKQIREELTDEYKEPILKYAKQELDLTRIQGLTFGFREELGNASILLEQITFEEGT